jgi:alginate O-acetyltransferase complex protein AlgI
MLETQSTIRAGGIASPAPLCAVVRYVLILVGTFVSALGTGGRPGRDAMLRRVALASERVVDLENESEKRPDDGNRGRRNVSDGAGVAAQRFEVHVNASEPLSCAEHGRHGDECAGDRLEQRFELRLACPNRPAGHRAHQRSHDRNRGVHDERRPRRPESRKCNDDERAQNPPFDQPEHDFSEHVPKRLTQQTPVFNVSFEVWVREAHLGGRTRQPGSGILSRALLFNTLEYAKFFALVFAISWLLARAQKLRILFLLGASYAFYASWNFKFVPLIFASSTADWLLGNAIARATEPRARRRWLAATAVLNLGVLFVFKYLNFGIDTARTVLAALGFHPPELALSVVLPIGVSFFTFESMSYVIDVYRGDIEPHESYLEYLAFVAFFPHLVAGPIVRPRDLLPQLAAPARWDDDAANRALFLIALGLLKKVAIGDYLAVNLVDRVFDAPLQFSALECYAGVVGYAIQIYCDFSGYTDIAIGSALLLGVRFPKNFDAPYTAIDPQDFWRRWHISLSTWLRDYLYIPLGGNRQGPTRTYVNLMATMLLGGLWHGANWTFVVWGGLHGVALAVTRAFSRARPEAPVAPSGAARAVRIFLTFHFVCATWIFFRADTFRGAMRMFSQLSTLTTFHPNLPPAVLAVLCVGLVSHFVPDRWYESLRRHFSGLPALAQGRALSLVAVALRRMGSAEAVPFVYFQF